MELGTRQDGAKPELGSLRQALAGLEAFREDMLRSLREALDVPAPAAPAPSEGRA